MSTLYRNKTSALQRIVFLTLFLFVFKMVSAHDVIRDLETMSRSDTAILYLKLGYKHILPLGFDHILFVLSLYFFSTELRPVLWQSLAFTLAHSVTLGLAMYHLISLSAALVEPLIALSIMFVALENVFSKKLKPSRIGVIFCFGLVHGLGFASALNGLGLPQNSYLSSLVMFNAGVELGQLTVIVTAFLLVGRWFGKRSYYKRFVVVPISLMIAAIAFFIFIQRVSI